ncbi:hypothetical protein ALC56_15352 [Trachymyrmex septentrionalis]|uniref:Uncharacterized protein n=1 Tax=Trachymyrmex septentrionalis TaxID=34720 RepID=A0A151JSL1_9HYME|nr:hypothetical protein ALC56_15352 [Trachymyrmex septentrionalis]
MYARNLKECMSKNELKKEVLGNVVIETAQTGSSIGYENSTDNRNWYRGNWAAAHVQS